MSLNQLLQLTPIKFQVETRDHFTNGAKLKSQTSRTIKNNEMTEKKKSGTAIGGIVLVGCLLIGAGIGNMSDKIEVGASTLIGLGVGFIAMATIWAYYRNR